MSWVAIILTFALVDNVILSRLLGVEAAAFAPGGMRAAAGVGGFIAVLMAVSAVGGWAVDSQVLMPLGFTLLRTPVFVFFVAGLAFALRAICVRFLPSVLQAAGVSIPEIAVNTAALGLVLITTRGEYTALESLVAGLAAGAGYFFVTAMMMAISERLEVEPVPRALKGFPLQLITAGLIAYAFMAFDRAFLARVLGG
ncbi:MAG: Rnf-Nqr domain containing protein [Spirochaetia bacterium]|jgi:electron transport complex protein RnfA